MHPHVGVCTWEPDFQGLGKLSRQLRLPTDFPALNIRCGGRLGCPTVSVSVLGQELDAPLIECECMPKIADMLHPIDGSWQHAASTRNSNRGDGVPKPILTVTEIYESCNVPCADKMNFYILV
jgi:hypothetical protein